MLRIKNLSVKKNDTILENINLDVNKGDVVCILGQNGEGKSTLLKAIMGYSNMFDITGTISFNDIIINDLSMNNVANLGIFLSLQDPVEIPGLKLLDFYRVIYQNKFPQESFLKFSIKLEKILKQVGLNQDFLKRNLNENFSGGEKKKNEIIQMLILNPELILLDEFDSGLDFDTNKLITQILNDEIKSKHKTVIFISHHIDTIKALNPNKVILLSNKQIVAQGDINLAIEIFDKGYQKVLSKFGITKKVDTLESCNAHHAK